MTQTNINAQLNKKPHPSGMDSKLKQCQKLGKTLDLQTTQMKNMHDILLQEYRALKADDIDLFQATLIKKQKQISALESIEPQLALITNTINEKMSKLSMEKYIRKISSGNMKKKILSVWNKLQSTIEQCDEQNKINNRILYASQTSLKQALSILRGNTDVTQAQLYGSSGKQKDDANGQSLAIA